MVTQVAPSGNFLAVKTENNTAVTQLSHWHNAPQNGGGEMS